ncbi:nuclear receptor subfamily 1 group D member 2b isoform X2 [Etheostoma spectabile]|uniref:nuclear receptor subfamily 1 group D member 2b isoform X2 n=1 Tax=Etheostoma spectabile TaxID=54343 RepID=UPI0013AEEB96|nr:nuclear receptor subfamily 1 group D member 2-like isoform X2 [Etheostoma spectabile]
MAATSRPPRRTALRPAARRSNGLTPHSPPVAKTSQGLRKMDAPPLLPNVALQGFFRRSIQQNIQYKKCLKNESCPIMRTNRNRCQQCRFKKCLMVGMSRDSVRFGRIPKREKQRMLLEMQSAMNNMMNSSQLQSQLHASHTLPIGKPLASGAIEATSGTAGPASSSSSPPSSLPSSGQSDPSSQPEPAIAMDTSPSSASLGGSDSGEEEVIGSVTRAHQETFMYNQEPSSLAAESPPSATDPPNCTAINYATNLRAEEWQDPWNHHNNLVTMATQAPPPSSLGPQDQEENSSNYCPFRLSRAATASNCPAYTHAAFGAPPLEGPVGGPYSGPLWRGGNRMHLVCPMNTSPYVDPQRSGHEVWEEFSHSFTPAVREVVEFAKKIPGFRDLTQHDQVSLLKAGTFEVLVVRFASLFDVKERTVTFLGGEKYCVDTLRAMGAGDLLNSMFDFSEKLTNLGLSEEEMSLFTAVVLVSADRSGIENVNSVEALQETLIRALRSLITKKHPNESAIFTKLLLKLPDLRSLNNMHSEELLAFKVHS